MKKPGFRTALPFAAAAAGYMLVDILLDQFISSTPTFGPAHLFLSLGLVLVSLFVISNSFQTRRRAEDALRQGRDELERRVQQRTAELELANASLQAEISERQRAEGERLRFLEQVENARRHAEELAAELQLTNDMLHALLDTLPVGMVILNPDGEIVLANPLARAIMGKALTGDATDEHGAPLLFRMDGSPVHPADLPLNRALRLGETTTGMEVQMRRDDGSQAFIFISAGPVRDPAGNLSGAVKIVQDISRLKHMEQALRESEERYRTQFDVFPEPGAVWDHNGVLIMQNLVSARYLGGPREDFIGKTAQELFGQKASEFLERLKRVLETGVSENREERVESTLGTRFLWTTLQRVRGADGQFSIQSISYDITERKQAEVALRASEEKLATVFQFSPAAIAIVRVVDGILIDANPAATKLLGFPRAELIGKAWKAVNPFSDLSGEAQMIAQFQEKGQVSDYELDFEVRPGGPVTQLVSLIPIQVGGEACILAIAHDITLRKRSEETLRQVQTELAIGIQERTALHERQRLARELHDSVSQALYGISLGAHTALTLIDSNPVKVREALDYVISLTQAGLAEMRALIFELRPESLELEGLVNALLKQAAALRARHGMEVNLSLCNEPDAPIAVKEALYRIAQEGLQNAVKHARANRLEVCLSARSDFLELEVCDDGIGFDPGVAYPGHLGLSSMRERAANLGGTLEILSTVRHGTRIRAVIPTS